MSKRLVLVVAVAALVVGSVWLTRGAAARTPRFSGEQAMGILVELCAIGPRVPGSAAHDRAADFIIGRLESAGAVVEQQSFEVEVPGIGTVTARNLIGRFQPERRDRVTLSAHWDSRPWADADPDSSRHHEPVLGANDSASGVSVLLALAPALGASAAAYGVDLVFFDAEDCGRHGDPRSFCKGSQEFVRRMLEPPIFLINLDMIGDAELRIAPEAHGELYAPQLRRYVWERAQRLGIKQFVDAPLVEVYDDHVPFLEAGVQAIDLIDFDYAHWHTVEDTPDKCAVGSLQVIGDLVASLVYER